jgi:D-tyrosyl-tRNA(Tyr) deacylase
VQRVTRAQVSVEGEVRGKIGAGIVALIGVGCGDTQSDVDYIADKLVNLRIFEDEAGKMNLSLADTGGEVLAVSQFTLYGDARRGRRPGFSDAAPPDVAVALFDHVVARVEACGIKVSTGVFRAEMKVELVNDGPVTILLDSRKAF